MLAYIQICEADWIAEAREMDRRYHEAKLAAYAFAEPKLVYDEAQDWRGGLLVDSPAPQRITPDLMARAAAIWQRARAAEARHGAH